MHSNAGPCMERRHDADDKCRFTAPPALIVGIISDASSRKARSAIRATWLSPAALQMANRTLAMFVVGEPTLGCSNTSEDRLARELRSHSDLLRLRVPDCLPHFGAKVHAWYRHAVRQWPRAQWLAKAEDDAMVDLSALQTLLFGLGRSRHKDPWYVGRFGWTSRCWPLRVGCPSELGKVGAPVRDQRTRAAWEGCCAGCWGGLLASDRSRTLQPWGGCTPQTETLDRWETRGLVPSTRACGEVRSAPFAVGPLEARSRALARAVARCRGAHSYFAAMSAGGAALGGECEAGDAAQGHAVSECAPPGGLRLASFGPARHQKYPCWRTDPTDFPCQINTPADVVNCSDTLVIHPLKSKPTPGLPPYPRSGWHTLWSILRARPYSPAPLDVLEVSLPGGRLRLIKDDSKYMDLLTERGTTLKLPADA